MYHFLNHSVNATVWLHADFLGKIKISHYLKLSEDRSQFFVDIGNSTHDLFLLSFATVSWLGRCMNAAQLTVQFNEISEFVRFDQSGCFIHSSFREYNYK